MKRFNYNSIKERLLNRIKSNKEENNKLRESIVEVYIEGINSAANYAESITLKTNIKRPDNAVTEEDIIKYFGNWYA